MRAGLHTLYGKAIYSAHKCTEYMEREGGTHAQRNIPRKKKLIKKETIKKKVVFMLLYSATLLSPSPWWWCWGLQVAALPGAGAALEHTGGPTDLITALEHCG